MKENSVVHKWKDYSDRKNAIGSKKKLMAKAEGDEKTASRERSSIAENFKGYVELVMKSPLSFSSSKSG